MFTRPASYLILLFWLLSFCQPGEVVEIKHPIRYNSGAGQSLDQWYYERSYPTGRLATSRWVRAHQELKRENQQKRTDAAGWAALGPPNVGGRTLCLAFHPNDSNIIYAGAAGGGLWKTSTMGQGPDAWSYVPTGFPVLAVASVAIDPANPSNMLLGTGEMYNSFQIAEPGVVSRFSRGTYGIGILRTTDGGLAWQQVLDWSTDEMRGVQDIVYHSQNPQIVYAATTEGVYKSEDAGETWQNIHQLSIAVDIEVDPRDGDVIYVSYGNLNFTGTIPVGIFKSTDAGSSFVPVMKGLPPTWSGKAMIAIHPQYPKLLYASVHDLFTDPGVDTTHLGLYRSVNGGEDWVRQNNRNVALFQGWYSHDVALHPQDTQKLLYVGIDAWISDDAGRSLTKISDWRKSTFGAFPTEGPSGPPDYVHADIHGVYFHPQISDDVFLATDGGVFQMSGESMTFRSLNEGLQTTQFYANISCSRTDSNMVIGGTQDNATYLFLDSLWLRIIGGDGMSTAIDPLDDNIIYGSAQGLVIARTLNRADSFDLIIPPSQPNESTAFSAPYEVAVADPRIIYAGRQWLYRSTDRGTSWTKTSDVAPDGANVILSIAIAPDDPDHLYIATSSSPFSSNQAPKVLKSTNGGKTWEILRGLPDRVAKDIAIDPNDSEVLYCVFSGFGTSHVFKSTNGGETWADITGQLPDVPSNALLIDPIFSDHLYLANDLGVYFSADGGFHWEGWMQNLPDVVMAMHLSYSPSNRKIRLATHGNGLYERDIIETIPVAVDNYDRHLSTKIYPNPFGQQLNIAFDQSHTGIIYVDIISTTGRRIFSWQKDIINQNSVSIPTGSLLTPGIYFLTVKLHDSFSVSAVTHL